MVKSILRLALIGIVLVAVGGFVLGWWNGAAHEGIPEAVGTSGVAEADGDERRASEAALSDDALAVVIKSRLVRDAEVAAEGIRVRLDQGIITLSGTVRSEEQRRRAIQIARQAGGVQDVRDELVVVQQ